MKYLPFLLKKKLRHVLSCGFLYGKNEILHYFLFYSYHSVIKSTDSQKKIQLIKAIFIETKVFGYQKDFLVDPCP